MLGNWGGAKCRPALQGTAESDDDESDDGADELDSKSEERRLDGSRDYYPIREDDGRFGSHSVFDDMDV